jgi:hypothetical protein
VRRAVETEMWKGKKYGRKREEIRVRTKGIRKLRKRTSYTVNVIKWNLLRNYISLFHIRRLSFDDDATGRTLYSHVGAPTLA